MSTSKYKTLAVTDKSRQIICRLINTKAEGKSLRIMWGFTASAYGI